MVMSTLRLTKTSPHDRNILEPEVKQTNKQTNKQTDKERTYGKEQFVLYHRIRTTRMYTCNIRSK